MNQALARILLCVVLGACIPGYGAAQLTANERISSVGDAPLDPGPLATDLSPSIKPEAVQAAMRKVADWQTERIADSPSQDWTFTTLYLGLLAATDTLHDARYRSVVESAARHYAWNLGPRKTHADDQAIGQIYLRLYEDQAEPERIGPLHSQFDDIIHIPDDPSTPVWWWCDALFMAPPVWSGLSVATNDSRYRDYMHREWLITADRLWDPREHLFFRDNSYLAKRERNGRKVFWSRGNGWVMGGLVRVLETLPAQDPRRPYYVDKLQQMAFAIAKLQGADGLWRPGLLDAADYPYPEVSGSAFFIYAMAWGVNHHVLKASQFVPVISRGWAGLVSHIYRDGRLGCVQPVGAAPGAYSPGASYVFGTGSFLLAGSEVDRMSRLGLSGH